MATDNKKLCDLVRMNSPESVMEEAKIILNMISPAIDTCEVSKAFDMAIELYSGLYPGYRACNTGFHDLRHITDSFLAMVRLLHGAVIDGETLSERCIELSLISILFHDAGYIQEENDTEGTGAKYTENHVHRSMDFLNRHAFKLGLSEREKNAGRAMILCTNLNADIASITFPSRAVEMLSKMLAVADLIAQIADRTYLEKLLFLYQEFRESNTNHYKSELDLLSKTAGFYSMIEQRMEKQLGNASRFMNSHFLSRWGINRNLYHVAIENQKKFLGHILSLKASDPLDHLKRGNIVDSIRGKRKIGVNT